MPDKSELEIKQLWFAPSSNKPIVDYDSLVDWYGTLPKSGSIQPRSHIKSRIKTLKEVEAPYKCSRVPMGSNKKNYYQQLLSDTDDRSTEKHHQQGKWQKHTNEPKGLEGSCDQLNKKFVHAKRTSKPKISCSEMNYLLSVTRPGTLQVQLAPVHLPVGSPSAMANSDRESLAYGTKRTLNPFLLLEYELPIKLD